MPTFILLALTLVLSSYEIPKGWFEAGANPEAYDVGIDKGAGRNGSDAGTIKCIKNKSNIWGNLMQNFSPDTFLDKRIRMSGWLKSKEVSGWSSFWLRVDDKYSNKSLSFDNMHYGVDRSIKGTTDWTKYEIVLDVPKEAGNIAFGIMLNGRGQVWFDDFEFEIVDKSVPTTGVDKQLGPQNLKFDN